MVIDSVCTYCGVGCDISAEVEDNKIQKIFAKEEGTVSQGRLCIKGKQGWDFVTHSKRLRNARVRKSFLAKNAALFADLDMDYLEPVDHDFYEISYESAYELVARKLRAITDEHGAHSFAAIGGARTSCEGSYLFQHFTRHVVGSPHVDNCARVCHSPSLKGMRTTIGEGAMTNPFDDIYETEYMVVMGSNTTEGHPIVANRMLDVIKQKDIELAVLDVRRIQLSKSATNHLSIPYEANLMILNMMAYVILSENLVNTDFVNSRTKGYEEYKNSILNDPYANPEYLLKIPGYESLIEEIRTVARKYATRKSLFFWGLGITEHLDGSYAVMAITHLAMLTGNIGKRGAGLMPLRGQNNVQGTCDVGMLPYYAPDYQPPKEVGMMTPDLINAMVDGKIKALYNISEDIAHIHPNQNKIHAALGNLDLLVVNELFDNEITKFADIIFGVKSAYEKTGVYINAERRLHLSQPLINVMMPDDWEVIAEISKRYGTDLGFKTTRDVWEAVRIDAPIRFGGASYEKLEANRLRGLQWPVQEEDMPVLHIDTFRTKDGFGTFHYHQYVPRGQVEELLNAKTHEGYYLTTGRVLVHYNNSAQTNACEKLNRSHSEDTLLVSVDDEDFFEYKDFVVLKSEYGQSAPLRVKVSSTVKKGTLFTTFHHAKSQINFLFGDESDELIKTARFKSIKVEVIKPDYLD
ncbi:MAG: molybdopterin-dependent oxidoreductase [Sulfuricurvum sp.]|uniref:molybdopterin oxidoreductase family protein n=1 Tax=Sulfuricurvum sp. TaxID=2025608 RepID=UPI00261387C4|nr:molybdopterin-dependent oxidoreductase [Sulfuricurvum sp.]MDD5158823.1 molybdopterin-dependent oxidoreductase [Sulfuricurvum sp.]